MRGRRGTAVGPADVVERDLPVIAVREHHEWVVGHIDGAVHIPMGEVPHRLEEIPADGPFAVVCRSGRRSAHVATWLRERGYDAANLTGGMKAWRRDGFAIRDSDGGSGQVA